MKDLLDKLTSYNLFNNLLPGIIFVIFCKEFVGYNLIQENNILAAFLYYFIGMSISRFGSLVIEPVLIKLKILKYENYKSFVKTSKPDPKTEVLIEVNNTFRTVASIFFLLLITMAYELINSYIDISKHLENIILIILLLLLYLASFRKQTKYISKRIEANEPN